MFLEWKDEDYIFNNKIDGYYVLEKIGGIDYMDKMFEKKEKIYSILEKEGQGINLGKDLVLPEDKRGNTNVLVIGGSGSGKSASYTVPNLLRMMGSYIVIDIYGEIYEKTHEYLKKNGYKVKVINYKNSQTVKIVEEDRFDYNPLQYIKSEQDIEILSNILIGEEADDEFWKEASKCLMKAVIYYVMEKEERKDLLSCFKLLGETKDQLFERFEEFDENSKGAKYYSILKTFPEKTYQSIVSTAIMKLSFVINGLEEENYNINDFNIMDIVNEKVVVFIVINENHNEERKIGSIFVSQFLNYYTFDKTSNQHVYLLLDEFDKFNKIYNMARNIEVARGRKLSISLITNNLEKIKCLYGNDFYSIINSIDTQILLGTNVKEDIEYFSDLLGLDYEFIKNDLGKDKLLVAEKGLKAILAEKDYYFKHEEWINNII